MRQILLNIIILIYLPVVLFAQTVKIPEDAHFYNPEINSFTKVIHEPSGRNHAKLIQEAIDLVAANGGGSLIIKANGANRVYDVDKEVNIRTGVHIRVEPDVVFKSSQSRKITLFSAGKTGTQRIENFSMSCTNPHGYFVFDFSDRRPGVKEGGAIAVSIGGARNFKISDICVKDNYTPYSSITVNLLNLPNNKFLFATDGIIEHLYGDRGHYGYGLIQCQAAYNLLFRELDGEGGAALRLETGAIGKANLIDRRIHLDSIYATKIKCRNGQAALTLSPHTVNNGIVFIDNLTAISCEAGAIVASGFLSKKKGQCDEEGNAIDGYTYGFFDSGSVVSNLRVVYGTNAQLRPSRRIFVPCSQRGLLHDQLNPDEESYKGPTVSGIVYFAKRGTDINKGYYSVHLPGFIMEKFPEQEGLRENKEFVTSTEDGYKDCPDGKFDKKGNKTDNKRRDGRVKKMKKN